MGPNVSETEGSRTAADASPSKSLLTHPVVVGSLGATLVAEWLLPLQYRLVLFRQDLEVLAFACSVVSGGIAYGSYRRARVAGVFKPRWLLEVTFAVLAALWGGLCAPTGRNSLLPTWGWARWFA